MAGRARSPRYLFINSHNIQTLADCLSRGARVHRVHWQCTHAKALSWAGPSSVGEIRHKHLCDQHMLASVASASVHSLTRASPTVLATRSTYAPSQWFPPRRSRPPYECDRSHKGAVGAGAQMPHCLKLQSPRKAPLVDTEETTPPEALKSDQSLKCGCALCSSTAAADVYAS